MKAVSLQFPRHAVVSVPGDRLVITTFRDGKEVHACPHDTEDYRAHAKRSGVEEDVDSYCLQHDLAHVIFGEMLGAESPVLRSEATGESLPEEQLEAEEVITKLMQAYFNSYGWPRHLKGKV